MMSCFPTGLHLLQCRRMWLEQSRGDPQRRSPKTGSSDTASTTPSAPSATAKRAKRSVSQPTTSLHQQQANTHGAKDGLSRHFLNKMCLLFMCQLWDSIMSLVNVNITTIILNCLLLIVIWCDQCGQTRGCRHALSLCSWPMQMASLWVRVWRPWGLSQVNTETLLID